MGRAVQASKRASRHEAKRNLDAAAKADWQKRFDATRLYGKKRTSGGMQARMKAGFSKQRRANTGVQDALKVKQKSKLVSRLSGSKPKTILGS